MGRSMHFRILEVGSSMLNEVHLWRAECEEFCRLRDSCHVQISLCLDGGVQ